MYGISIADKLWYYAPCIIQLRPRVRSSSQLSQYTVLCHVRVPFRVSSALLQTQHAIAPSDLLHVCVLAHCKGYNATLHKHRHLPLKTIHDLRSMCMSPQGTISGGSWDRDGEMKLHVPCIISLSHSQKGMEFTGTCISSWRDFDY